MAQPQPQTAQKEQPPRNDFIHNAALGGAIITPLVMLMPPRRLDMRFLVLFTAFSLSTNQLAYEHTGTSIYQRIGNRFASIGGGMGSGLTELPERAQRTKQLLQEKKERDAWEKMAEEERRKVMQLGDAGKEKEDSSIASRIWMGSEKEGWKERRAEEHRKKLEEGQGLSDIIFEQIADVFSSLRGGSKKSDEDSEEKKS